MTALLVVLILFVVFRVALKAIISFLSFVFSAVKNLFGAALATISLIAMSLD